MNSCDTSFSRRAFLRDCIRSAGWYFASLLPATCVSALYGPLVREWRGPRFDYWLADALAGWLFFVPVVLVMSGLGCVPIFELVRLRYGGWFLRRCGRSALGGIGVVTVQVLRGAA